MPTEVFGDNTGDDYSGTEDNFLQEDAATTNNGSASNFSIRDESSGNDTHGCISFSGMSSLPSSITVSSATMSLYQNWNNMSSTQVLSCYRLLRNWSESQSTWNIYSTGNSWTTAGGTSDGNDKSATVSDTMTKNTTNQYYTSDDTAQLRTDCENIAAGTVSNYGWIWVRTDASDDGEQSDNTSSEGSDGQRPYLTITYTEGGGSSSSNLTLLGVG